MTDLTNNPNAANSLNQENSEKNQNETEEIFPFLLHLLAGRPVKWLSLGEVLIRTKGTKITARQMKEIHKTNKIHLSPTDSFFCRPTVFNNLRHY